MSNDRDLSSDGTTSPRIPSVLAINGGSSSVKFAIHGTGTSPAVSFRGGVDRIGQTGTTLTWSGRDGRGETGRVDVVDHDAAASRLIDWLEAREEFAAVRAVGHRVVHGMAHTEPERVTPELLDELRRATPYAPEHLPREIELIEAFGKRHPHLPQVACFDTAFHGMMPRVATLLPIPRRYQAKGVRRYGFHGLSFAYLVEELARVAGPDAAHGRLILAHLGNGASLAAVREGTSIDTTMGFTPAAGLVMGTRTGDLDPGLVSFLAHSERMTAPQFHQMINHESGLLGVSEISADMRDLLAREADDDIAGPGHGGPGMVANAYLEQTYSEIYPHISQDEVGMKRLFTQFSFPGGIPSHVAPETPGSIHEGGELGYSLSHAYGAAFDNPDLLVACVVGDGEAETAALATSWHSNKFLNPVHDGAVLPILHLNGYKIAGPTVLARIPREELEALFRGYGYVPHIVEGDDPMDMHQQMAETLDRVVADVRGIQRDARANGFTARPRWPMIILRSPKGWTGPAVVDGQQTEGTFRSHQVPMGDMSQPGHVKILETWLKSYRPEELFDTTGRLVPELAALAPTGERRMSANPHANGGLVLRDLQLPDFRDYAVAVPQPGAVDGEATRVQGEFIRDVIQANPDNFRVFSPDETTSNRWNAVFEVTSRCSTAEILPEDDHVAPDGRVMEMFSEHQCEGWLEGYLLTGRHGFFSCYEAFIHIIDSMFNQHAKWLKVSNGIPWRRPIASLNYLLTSHVWRQDHNGFSHQDPGFIDHVVNKKADVIRVYLPPDANTLLSVTDHCLRSRNYVNVVVAGKQPSPQWLDMDAAVRHCSAGLGVWSWASNDQGGEPDVVMACCGDVPTLETLAAVALLRSHFPDVKVRVINVVNLMKLQPDSEHPHGLSDAAFDALFTTDKPIIFAYHGYPLLIHRLTYRRTNHHNLHVRGYKEEGTTTTPFDMVVLNDLDRFHLVADVIDRVPALAPRAAHVRQAIRDKLVEHKLYIATHGEDMPEIRNWRWGL